jgi:hypothetical protein
VDGITASGADAGNYSFNANAATSANITPADHQFVGTQVYNGTTTINRGFVRQQWCDPGVAGQTLVLSGTGTAEQGCRHVRAVRL